MARLRSILEDACAEARCSLNALTVLSTRHDPFRVDTPARHRDGNWLAEQAERLLNGRQIHLRGFHYLLLCAEATKPNGKQYASTFADWQWLQEKAAKPARWLKYIPFEQIIDARNAEPAVIVREQVSPTSYVSGGGVAVEIPSLGFFAPSVDVVGFSGVQPYKVVLWGEKSSLEPVLDPIAGRYGADLYLGTGETSDTLLHQMAENGVTDGRRIVVLCFCDCDPGGWQMPISIARKLQAFQALEFPELEFEVRRVALTPEQVREHKLPEAPLNESEKRAGKWKQAMGVEQTEIDALAVLNPALLRRIALDAIAPFYDDTLAARVAEVREAWRHEAQRLLDEQIDQEKLDRLRDEAEAQVEAFREEVAAINDAVEAETRGFRPPKLPAVPEPVLDGKQSSPPLIDSDWSFVDQTRRLKASRAYEDVA